MGADNLQLSPREPRAFLLASTRSCRSTVKDKDPYSNRQGTYLADRAKPRLHTTLYPPLSCRERHPPSRNLRLAKAVPRSSLTMTIDGIVTDPALRSFLQTSQNAREQALGLADRLAISSSPDAPPLTTDQQIELSKEQKLLNTNISSLRGLHRGAYMGARDTKAQTAEARQEVDVLHLQLQNLYYEQAHLQGEIAACESYE